MNIFIDKQFYSIDPEKSTRIYTDEGYLKVKARVARVGIQKYLASELALDNVDPYKIVRVYRPPHEVFSEKSLDSFCGAVVTDEHPTELVDSKNYKKYELGCVMSKGSQEDNYVVVDMLIRDADVIKKIENGKQQVSAGYTADYEYYDTEQMSDYGAYDVIQKSPIINHIAIVQNGRAGESVRVLDTSKYRVDYMKITTDTGSKIDVIESNAEIIVNEFEAKTNFIKKITQDHDLALSRAKSDFDEKLSGLKSSNEVLQGKLDAAFEEIKSLKTMTNDTAMYNKLQEANSILCHAKLITHDKFTCDTLQPSQIKRCALAIVNADLDWNEKSDEYCSARFDAYVEQAQEKHSEKSTYDSQIANLSNFQKQDDSNTDSQVQSRAFLYQKKLIKGE